ncbi:hypothetical protein [Nocardioides dilutus]
MKTLTGLFTAMLMAAGLMAVATPSASAAACNSYSGCVDTTTTASAPKVVPKRRKATVCGTVAAVGSNATPRGELRFVVKRNRGKYNFRKTVPYEGGKMCVVTKKVKRKGGYTVNVAFVPLKGSIFNPSSGSTGFDVGR